MRIGLITTLNTNIGDDFIRAGICSVLQTVFPDQPLEFVAIHKHAPYSVYGAWHPIHLRNWTAHLPKGRGRARAYVERWAPRLGLSRLDRCDLVIQCGTPVLWPGCAGCEWAGPVWDEVVGRLAKRGVPVLNLGAGSCYPWEARGEVTVGPEDAEYLERIARYCRINTVRDELAQQLWRRLGIQSEVIACPALLAGPVHAKDTGTRETVLLNYMEKGGHFEWGQQVNAEVWRDTVRQLIHHHHPGHRFIFLCHDRKEYELAQTVDPRIERRLPTSLPEYFELVATARIAVCNRLHASVALAGLGIPSVAVGTDTRLLMVQQLGLPCLYVKEATTQVLLREFERLLQRAGAEGQRLSALRQATFERYVGVVRGAVASL